MIQNSATVLDSDAKAIFLGLTILLAHPGGAFGLRCKEIVLYEATLI